MAEGWRIGRRKGGGGGGSIRAGAETEMEKGDRGDEREKGEEAE